MPIPISFACRDIDPPYALTFLRCLTSSEACKRYCFQFNKLVACVKWLLNAVGSLRTAELACRASLRRYSLSKSGSARSLLAASLAQRSFLAMLRILYESIPHRTLLQGCFRRRPPQSRNLICSESTGKPLDGSQRPSKGFYTPYKLLTVRRRACKLE